MRKVSNLDGLTENNCADYYEAGEAGEAGAFCQWNNDFQLCFSSLINTSGQSGWCDPRNISSDPPPPLPDCPSGPQRTVCETLTTSGEAACGSLASPASIYERTPSPKLSRAAIAFRLAQCAWTGQGSSSGIVLYSHCGGGLICRDPGP